MPATGPTSPFTLSMSGVCSLRRRARVWMGLRFHTTTACWPSCSRLMRFCLREAVEVAPGAEAVEAVAVAGLVEPVAGAEVRVEAPAARAAGAEARVEAPVALAAGAEVRVAVLEAVAEVRAAVLEAVGEV